MGRVGIWQLVIVLVIVLLIFGPSNLPKLARIVGGWFREFNELKNQIPTKEDLKPKPKPAPPALEAQTAQPATPPAAAAPPRKPAPAKKQA